MNGIQEVVGSIPIISTRKKSTTSVVLFCFIRQGRFGLTLLPHSGVSLVFAGIAVSVLEGSAPEYAPLIQGTIAAAADARQPGPGKTLRHTRKITGRHPVPGAFSDIERSWDPQCPLRRPGIFAFCNLPNSQGLCRCGRVKSRADSDCPDLSERGRSV